MLTENGAPDENRTRRNSIDSRAPSPAGSRGKLKFLQQWCGRRDSNSDAQGARPSSAGVYRSTTAARTFFEVRTFGTTIFELEDQVGLEPTVTCVDGLRIRSLGRWGHWSMIGGSGWFRTTCAPVKRPLHLQSGLTLRIRRLDGCGGKPRRFRVCQRRLALGQRDAHAFRLDLHLLASCCIFSRQGIFRRCLH
jgi:hypothetical protein